MNRYMSFPHTYGIIYIICQIKAVVENIKEYILETVLNTIKYWHCIITMHSVNIV